MINNTKDGILSTPNHAIQAFLDLFKWFLIVIIVNNAIWAAVHFGYFSKSFGAGNSTTIDAVQSGEHNNQEITNG